MNFGQAGKTFNQGTNPTILNYPKDASDPPVEEEDE